MESIFAGKRIVVGVTGSIAAFKVAGWVSSLTKEDARVSVVMTAAACRFVTPLTFAALSGNRVHSEMFSAIDEEEMTHLDLGREADLMLIAPASANSIAGLAAGLAGDLLGTAVLATQAPVLICPAMNSRMFRHPATQANLARLREYGYTIVDPDCGVMACREVGEGRLVEWETVREYLARSLSPQDLAGSQVLITAGPTREPLDPARFLSNRSSGKMGYALAQEAFRRGASVTLVSGPSSLPAPIGVERVMVQTAREMHREVLALAESAQIVIKAAAVADFRPAREQVDKVKKNQIDTALHLAPNPDILLELGRQKKAGQILVGFAAESRDLLTEGRRKLQEKNLDLIAVNDISGSQSGFEVDSNQVVLLSRDGQENLPQTSKRHTAELILDRVVALRAADTSSPTP
jgi:phosphopantothenoylcysteine decarboxylase / phosphopantothenate---cysteine ligase